MAATATRYGHISLTEFMGEEPDWVDVKETTRAAATLAREEWEANAENSAELTKVIVKQIAAVGDGIIRQIGNAVKAFSR